MTTILLIDDDEFENVVMTRLIANHVKYGFRVDFARSIDEAIKYLKKQTYDHVYLDDVLSYDVNATVSVEQIKAHLNGAPLVIISNNIERDYLKSNDILNVDAIVSKNDLSDYIYATAA